MRRQGFGDEPRGADANHGFYGREQRALQQYAENAAALLIPARAAPYATPHDESRDGERRRERCAA
jgi:hypothetical protein